MKNSTVAYLKSFTVQHNLIGDPDDPKNPMKFEVMELEEQRVLLSNKDPLKINYDRYFSELSPERQETILERMLLASKMLAITSYSDTKFADEEKQRLAPDFYVGSGITLTLPYNGTYYGAVRGTHPFGVASIGGASMKVDVALVDLDSLWVTIEGGAPDRPDRQPSSLVYLSGVAEPDRGVQHVEALSPYDPTVTAAFSVATRLDEEEYF
jgi:hypothetical protein